MISGIHTLTARRAEDVMWSYIQRQQTWQRALGRRSRMWRWECTHERRRRAGIHRWVAVHAVAYPTTTHTHTHTHTKTLLTSVTVVLQQLFTAVR